MNKEYKEKIRRIFARPRRLGYIEPKAYSRDGYLINQGLLKGLSYGRRLASETGCGFVACYNFLHFMGERTPALKVARQMERLLLGGGWIGTHPLAVGWNRHCRGYRLRVAVSRGGTERMLERSPARTAGIIAYRHRKGAHFAAFVREDGDEKLRFLNAVYGAENDRQTVGEFFERRAAFPLCMTLVAR